MNHVPEMDDGLGKPVLESVVPSDTEDHVDAAPEPKTMDAESCITTNIIGSKEVSLVVHGSASTNIVPTNLFIARVLLFLQ